MISYPSLVAGVPVDAPQWVHTLRASAALDDPSGSLRLKLRLDRGTVTVAEDDPRVVGRVGTASLEDSAEALAAARAAQRAWARRPLADREHFGAVVHRRLQERAADYADVLIAEGHPRRLAEWEVDGVLVSMSPAMFDAVRPSLSTAWESDGRRRALVRKADGVVCVNPPQNAGSNAMMAAAVLAGGNAVVLRAPSSAAFGVAWLWHEIIQPSLMEVEAPAGVGSLVCGKPAALFDQWLESPHVDDVLYFGASRRGVAFARDCEAHGKKPVLELAGNDAVVVWRDADLRGAARAAAECFIGSAQICMVPKQVVVHPAVADEFLTHLLDEVAAVRPGPPESPEVLLSPVLKSADYTRVLTEARAAGAELLSGGYRTDSSGRSADDGAFIAPTILRVDSLEQASELEAVVEETFFPLLPVVVPTPSEDSHLLDALVEFVDANPYGLRNSFWAADPAVIDRFVTDVRTGGILKVNESHIGFVEGLPTHGGTGLSGGVHGEANFPILRTSHLQAVSISPAVVGADSAADVVQIDDADEPAPQAEDATPELTAGGPLLHR